jgi:hypothetical protein
MEENLQPDEELVKEEQELQEAPLPLERQEGNLGVLPVLFTSLAKSVFGPADALENDRRYKKVVRENYEVWAKNNPGKFSGKLFVRTKSGNLVINPELEKHLPTLDADSKSQFAKLHPKRAELYRKIEQKRLYLHQEDDPAIKALHKEIDRKTMAHSWNQGVTPTTPGSPLKLTHDQIRATYEDQFTKDFVSQHPEKARYYAKSDPKIKAAFEEHKQEEWAKKSRRGRIITRLNSPDLVPVVEKKSWMPKRMRRTSDWYDNKKQVIKDWFNKSKAGRLLGWNKLQRNRLSQWYKNKKDALKQWFNKTKVGRVYLKYTSFKNYFAVKKEEIKERAKKYLLRKLIPKGLQKFSPRNIAGKLLRKALSALIKRLPGIAGVIGRGLLGAKKILGNAFRQGVRGLTKAAGSLIKSAVKQGILAASRAVAGTIASTASLTPVLVAGGIILFIIIFIVIIIAIFGGGGNGNDQTNNPLLQVSINKTGPTGVPDQNSPIVYTIIASANPASSLTVTDYIPENATYDSSSPQGKLFDASGVETQEAAKAKTVVWTIGSSTTAPTAATSGTPQPTPPPTQGSSLSQTISLTLKATKSDSYILNKAIASATSGGGGTNPGAKTLIGMFQESAAKYNVPVALLMAINKLEISPDDIVDNWTDADIQKFSTLNWWQNASSEDLRKGWAFNQCETMGCAPGSDVQGIMQFEIGTWDWVGSGLVFPDGHPPNRLYPRDAIYAAGNLTRIHADEYDAAYGTQANDWPEDKIRRASGAYCAGNINGNFGSEACSGGGAPYDEVIWRFYQEFKAKGY